MWKRGHVEWFLTGLIAVILFLSTSGPIMNPSDEFPSMTRPIMLLFIVWLSFWSACYTAKFVFLFRKCAGWRAKA